MPPSGRAPSSARRSRGCAQGRSALTTRIGPDSTPRSASSTASPWFASEATIVLPTVSAAASTSASIASASAARASSGSGRSRSFALSLRNGTTTVGMPRSDYPQVKLDNAAIAGRLEAFASLLDLAGAGPYTARAYRRAADLIRTTPAPIEELVRVGRVRELRGIGPGIERRLRELVEIAELQELEREISPELAGLGPFLGVSTKRMLEIGRTLGVRTLPELREGAAAGRLREVPGIGAETERKLLAALRQEMRPV